MGQGALRARRALLGGGCWLGGPGRSTRGSDSHAASSAGASSSRSGPGLADGATACSAPPLPGLLLPASPTHAGGLGSRLSRWGFETPPACPAALGTPPFQRARARGYRISLAAESFHVSRSAATCWEAAVGACVRRFMGPSAKENWRGTAGVWALHFFDGPSGFAVDVLLCGNLHVAAVGFVSSWVGLVLTVYECSLEHVLSSCLSLCRVPARFDFL